MSEVAADTCPECGAAAYIGMNNVECTNYTCRHHDEPTRLAHIKGHANTAKTGDPVLETLPYRDFCTDCGLAADFERWLYTNGSLAAWCPHCGQPNYWGTKTVDFSDEDTDPMHKPILDNLKHFTLDGNPLDVPSLDDILNRYTNPKVDKGTD